jgi:uracil phosphoribosyltransferase
MEQVHVSNHPLIRHKLTLLRDKGTDHKQFRELIRELAVLLAYEATADLGLEEASVSTPMGAAEGHRLTENIGLIPVLRSGLGMVEGFWEMMPGAQVWAVRRWRQWMSSRDGGHGASSSWASSPLPRGSRR